MRTRNSIELDGTRTAPIPRCAGVEMERPPLQDPSLRGILVPFLPMTCFDFTFLTNGSSANIIVHPALNVVDYSRALLVVRIHEISMVATQTLTLAAYGTAPSPADRREFVMGSSSLYLNITSSTSAGTVATNADTDLLPYLMMKVTANQGGATGGQSLVAVLSADLLLKE